MTANVAASHFNHRALASCLVTTLAIVALGALAGPHASAAVATCADPEPVCKTGSASCAERVAHPAGGTVEVFRNLSLGKTHCKVTHAVIVFHGRDRNPDAYFERVVAAATMGGRLETSLIVSPFFREKNDSRQSGDLYWDRSKGSQALVDWAQGGDSKSPVKVSSFAVIDELIASIVKSGHFPNLRTITLAGHSAGGQIVQRYAVGGNSANESLGPRFSYVVSNPSSYVYLSAERPVTRSTSSFALPGKSACEFYNEYGYGLDDLNRYLSRFSKKQLIDRYVRRDVTYLLGSSDTGNDDLDTSCFANAQGKNRFERGSAYAAYIRAFFPAAAHLQSVVPGVGHSSSKMFKSKQGIEALFPPGS